MTNKNDKTEELLGISFAEFKKYIEFLMTPEITWKSVHLDHIQPLSSFNLTDPKQLKTAAHYTNIQPLLKKDNLIKRKDQDFMIMIYLCKEIMYMNTNIINTIVVRF